MGTRARVNVFDGNQILVSIYRQMDGYPNGLGREVAEFCAARTIVNGYSPAMTAKNHVNGMGCLAAQLIEHLKGGDIGSIYIRDTSPDSHGERYSYNLRNKDGQIWMDVLAGSVTMFGLPGDTEAEMKTIFSGFAKDFKIPEDAEA